MQIFKKLGILFFSGSLLLSYSVSTLAESPAKAEKKDEKQADQQMQQDIIATLQKDAQFSTLVSALKTANLLEKLKGPGPFTIFAPSNAAFAKLPPGTLDALMKNEPKLEKVLLYHVVPGKKMAKEVMTISSAQTAAGNSLTIKVKDGGVMADNAKVVKTDIPTSNGVIHIIDTVLMPQ